MKANDDMLQILYELINNWENEIVEFKQADKSYKQHEIGQYFSALSNEANLKGLQYGWLVFGVHNATRGIVGTDYRDKAGLEKLKHEIADNTTDGITFTDIFEVYDKGMRVIMFKIPAAVAGVPTAWKGHWYGRDGESLSALSAEELDRLRSQARLDWSRQLIEGSNIKCLDEEAIRIARENYKIKQNRNHISVETDKMSDEEFLTKMKLVVNGKLSNAAMVLLGNSDYDNILETPVRIMWRLYGSKDMVKDYMEFNIPFITAIDKVYAKIRNLTYRYMPNQMTLFPMETQQYDADLLRELLNNCIAHQDYLIGGRIYLDEFEDTVIVSNPGSFLPGDVHKVLKPSYTAPYYRNQLLADAMAKFNMIDTVQMGIRKVFNIQRNRCFPMPDYDLSTPKKVAVTVYGKVLDVNYTHLLFERDDLALETVFLLDRIQKKLPLEKEQYKTLRKLGMVEGKMPNVYVSAKIADIIGERAQYTKNKAMDDKYYMDLIINYLQQFGSGTKADIRKLLGNKLSDVLNDKQKDNKVRYLLASMQSSKIIERTTTNKRASAWQLKSESGENSKND
ncbi:MAG: putative DNA binding domain-containing protein [Clostridiales bacterium]|nr:putative DNA binding domain-containing protein [Clostridiales bacterium]